MAVGSWPNLEVIGIDPYPGILGGIFFDIVKGNNSGHFILYFHRSYSDLDPINFIGIINNKC